MMSTINQVAKKWANRAMKELKARDITPDLEDSMLAEYNVVDWDEFEIEIKTASDYRKILHSDIGQSPRAYAYDLVDEHAKLAVSK